MRVKVTLQNILEYGLDTITGNTRSAMLARAKELEDNGYELYVRIPDAEGGTNDAPTERNAFEHYDGFPEPDGVAHNQESLSLEEQAYVDAPCSYVKAPQIDGSFFWICTKHGVASKHSVDSESREPCIAVDPYP